ncbi:YitT family protein [Mycoplasma sp. ATU-Cv-508]
MQRKRFSWVWLVGAAFLYAFGINAFVNAAGIFPTGLMAFANLTIYLAPDATPFASLIYFALNIPLIAIFWKKISRRYIYKSLYFLVLQALFGLFFLIPQVGEFWIKSFWTGREIDAIREERWTVILLAAIGAAIVAVGIGVAWKTGGGTGGTDIIVYYFSHRYKKSVGLINTFVSLFMVAISFTISVALNRPTYSHDLWFIILIGTLTYLFVTVVIIDLIYPKYSKVKLDIYSNQPEKVSAYLKNSNFHHAWSIIPLKSGYTGQDKKVITTTILLLELGDIIRKLYAIDKDLWIIATKIKFNYGRFNTDSVDQN